MIYTDFFNVCEQILYGIGDFASRGIEWFFTPYMIGNQMVTPFYVLTAMFFTWALARLVIEFVT